MNPPPPLDPERTALFLDLDGTIAAIEARPDQVGPLPGRTRALRSALTRLGGRVAALTGRGLEDADHILEGCLPCVAAVHGLTRRLHDGSVVRVLASPQLSQAKLALEALAARHPGLIVEDKGASLALHYRLEPAAEQVVRDATDRIARSTELVVQQGSMVSELRTAGPHKGDSLRAYMSEPPFAGFTPIMVGDDLTDEHAFAASEALGGYGILVGPPRDTHARFRLADTAAVLEWLEGR